MALQDQYFGKVSLGMSNRKSSTHMVRLNPTAANAYIFEITQLLKDGTDVGQYFLSVEDLSAGTLIAKGVELKTEDDAADYPAPDAKIWAWDKISISFHAGFDNYTVTIPGRDNTQFTVGPDGATIDLTAGAVVPDFVTRFNAVVYAKNNAAATLDSMYVSS